MTTQAFTRNYADHSNQHGFQFEFYCDRCGSGFRSAFETSRTGFASSIFDAAGSLFGGEVQRAAWGADRMSDALRGPAWDAAFKRAINEALPNFRQCTTCGRWVCPEVCWNQARGLCTECAPDLAQQAPSIQAQVAVEQAWQHARETDQTGGVDARAPGASAAPAEATTCTGCQAALPSGTRFCPHCGAAAGPAPGPSFCAQCGGQVAAGSRFCPHCGRPMA
jgi:Double zinc ribbon/Prokaryotic RING finger family 2